MATPITFNSPANLCWLPSKLIDAQATSSLVRVIWLIYSYLFADYVISETLRHATITSWDPKDKDAVIAEVFKRCCFIPDTFAASTQQEHIARQVNEMWSSSPESPKSSFMTFHGDAAKRKLQELLQPLFQGLTKKAEIEKIIATQIIPNERIVSVSYANNAITGTIDFEITFDQDTQTTYVSDKGIQYLNTEYTHGVVKAIKIKIEKKLRGSIDTSKNTLSFEFNNIQGTVEPIDNVLLRPLIALAKLRISFSGSPVRILIGDSQKIYCFVVQQSHSDLSKLPNAWTEKDFLEVYGDFKWP